MVVMVMVVMVMVVEVVVMVVAVLVIHYTPLAARMISALALCSVVLASNQSLLQA